LNLHHKGQAFDLITVVAALESSGQLEVAGEKDYLIKVVQNTPGAANILYYAQIVRDKSILRALIQSSNEISETCYHPQGMDISQVLDIAENRIMSIAEHGTGQQRDYQLMEDLLAVALDKIDELYHSNGNITGLETHLTDFDEVTSGLQKGDLIIVAGRPSMGKTTFSMNLAEKFLVWRCLESN